ncbi:MAG: helix-turn-helix transcriptional regulator [Clostridia bacterium]
MNLNEIINRVRIIRNRANLSARELSLSIDKAANYISLLESQKRSFEPSLSTLLEIIYYCGSTPEEFFYGNIHQYALDKQVLDFTKTLSSYQKDAILNLYKK